MILRERSGSILTLAAVAALLLAGGASLAGPIRDRFVARMQQEWQEEEGGRDAAASLPPGVQVVRDVAYGRDERQRFDVYRTAQMSRAPAIFLVHGGAWRWGDKAAPRLIDAKVARWVPKGIGVISVDYRMLPTDPIEQARDVARALAVAQRRAAEWGLDGSKLILMGHSAGAHLIMLLAASPSLTGVAGATPWLGTVSLDSAALDVVAIMEHRHLPLYDRAFGSDPDYWRSASPLHALAAATRPVLLVCSSRRADSCSQARQFAAGAASLGSTVSVLEQDLAHGEINARLGVDSAYTAEVERFLARLDEAVAKRLR